MRHLMFDEVLERQKGNTLHPQSNNQELSNRTIIFFDLQSIMDTG